jgi:hypothetical protein
MPALNHAMQLSAVDWAIMLVYFLFVLGIGFMLKRSIKTSSDFFLSGRSIPAWVAGLVRCPNTCGSGLTRRLAASTRFPSRP